MPELGRSFRCLAFACALSAAGCRSINWPNTWPFPEYDRTTYEGPAMRIKTIEQLASRAEDVDSPDQRKITDELARQIQIERDPLVRLAIVRTLSEYRTPVVKQVLEAGLADESPAVRIACCRGLGRRADPSSVGLISQSLRSDNDIDVRLAAADALGQIETPESIQALVAALEDRNPALQYAGVESMKRLTGKDYGGDVQAWRQVAAGGDPPLPKPPSLAERIRSVSPF